LEEVIIIILVSIKRIKDEKSGGFPWGVMFIQASIMFVSKPDFIGNHFVPIF
jgi:hypothetical protein